jgi:8-oxo-dGTP pyrophosphatase MutT (NUDIX family)
MGYIQDLRKLIGNTPFIMVGATVLIFNNQKELLMMRRTDNLCWGLPGGAMEPCETIEVTARRETLEETGLEVRSLQLLNVFSGPDLFYQYPNGAEVYNVSVVFLAKESSGILLVNPEEHREFAFFALHKLPEVVSPPIKPILRWLQENKSHVVLLS